jgi:hypothetical protein
MLSFDLATSSHKRLDELVHVAHIRLIKNYRIVSQHLTWIVLKHPFDVTNESSS